MNELWKLGPIAIAVALRGMGFRAPEVGRRVELKGRCERGDLDDPTDMEKRLFFVRRLVQRGSLSEWAAVCRPPLVQP